MFVGRDDRGHAGYRATRGAGAHRTDGRPDRVGAGAAALVGLSLLLAGCGLHVSKHGISGSVFGHKFSESKGALPTGFPSDIPVPAHSRVVVGGGADNDWNVAFAVTGDVQSGATGYQAQFRSAGYAVTDVQAGSSSTPTSGTTSSTISVSGSSFTAANPTWKVEVVAGSTTASTAGELKPGEFGVDITVVPATTSPT